MEHPSNAAWAAIAVGVAAYDLLCPKGETLSEAVDRAMERPIGKFLVAGAIGSTALHLLNMLPADYDPIHQLAKRVRHD